MSVGEICVRKDNIFHYIKQIILRITEGDNIAVNDATENIYGDKIFSDK